LHRARAHYRRINQAAAAAVAAARKRGWFTRSSERHLQHPVRPCRCSGNAETDGWRMCGDALTHKRHQDETMGQRLMLRHMHIHKPIMIIIGGKLFEHILHRAYRRSARLQ